MTKWILFLRGINVGGKNGLPMAELRGVLCGIGCQDVVTYIQSGNCVLRSNHTDAGVLAREISEAIDAAKGFRPVVLCLAPSDLAGAIDHNPFEVEAKDENKVHFHFGIDGSVEIDMIDVEALRTPSEKVFVEGTVLYLYAPDGVGRSKLFAKLPKLIGQPVTVRNLRTVMKVADL